MIEALAVKQEFPSPLHVEDDDMSEKSAKSPTSCSEKEEIKDERQWSTIFSNTQKSGTLSPSEFVSLVRVQLRTRSEAETEGSQLSSRLYSSLKYLLRQEVTLKNKTNGEKHYQMLFMKIRVAESEHNQDFDIVRTNMKKGSVPSTSSKVQTKEEEDPVPSSTGQSSALTCSSFLKGKIEHALIPTVYNTGTTTYVSNSKIQFADVSYRQFCYLQIYFYAPDNLTEPIFTHVSPKFQVFARKQSSHHHSKTEQYSTPSSSPTSSPPSAEIPLASEKLSSVLPLCASPPKKRLKHIYERENAADKQFKKRRTESSTSSPKMEQNQMQAAEDLSPDRTLSSYKQTLESLVQYVQKSMPAEERRIALEFAVRKLLNN